MNNQLRPFTAGVVWALFTLALAVYLIHRVAGPPAPSYERTEAEGKVVDG